MKKDFVADVIAMSNAVARIHNQGLALSQEEMNYLQQLSTNLNILLSKVDEPMTLEQCDVIDRKAQREQLLDAAASSYIDPERER